MTVPAARSAVVGVRTVWLAPLVVAACGEPSPNGPASHAPTMADARAAERGRGQPRDFVKAAQIYSALCADGSGALDACVALADAIEAARGVDHDVRREFALYGAMCRRRGDVAACAASSMHDVLSWSRPPGFALTPEEQAKKEAAGVKLDAALATAEAACERGEGRACEVTAGLDPWSQSGTVESEDHEKWAVACQQGRYQACANLTHGLPLCDSQVTDPRCKALAQAGVALDDSPAAISLMGACRAGDPIARDYIPNMRVPVEKMCAAYDWTACAELGCRGDAAAGFSARAHGVEEQDCAHARFP